MPAISTGKVLITGANGFIAGWIAKTLIEHGFQVRGTIRSLEKAAPIRGALSVREQDLEFVVVEDITKASQPFKCTSTSFFVSMLTPSIL